MNRINLVDSRIKGLDSSEIYLTEKDLFPNIPLFKINDKLNVESFDEVTITGLLEHSIYIRYILKVADYLLKKKGKLKISFFSVSFDSPSNPLRNRAALMHEISVIYKERFKVVKTELIGKVFFIELDKLKETLPNNDSIDSWTFGLVSDGRKNKRILNTIEKIASFNIPNYEILICGPSPSNLLPKKVKVLSDHDLFFDDRVPISKKKNRIVQHAKFNNLVLFHDRILFPDNWYNKIKEYGNYFDGLCIKILDENTKSMRVQDWICTSLDKMAFSKSNSQNTQLAYDEWVPNWNINGGFMIIKKHLFDRVKLNPFLHWGEAEDGDLCRGLDRDGFSPVFYADAHVTSSTERLNTGTVKTGILGRIQKFKKEYIQKKQYCKNKKMFQKYLEQR